MKPTIMTTCPGFKAATKHRTRLIVLSVVLLIIGGYSCLWYALTDMQQAWISERLSSSKTRGITAYCENLHKSGYPLRISVACDSLSWTRPTAGLSLVTSRFVAGAPVYAPNWGSISISSPSNFELPGFPPINGEWENLEIDTDFENNTLVEIALSTDHPRLTRHQELDAGELFLKSEFFRFDARHIDNHFKVRMSFDELELPFIFTKEKTQIPAFSGMAEVVLQNAKNLFLPVSGALTQRLRGAEGHVEKIMMTFSTGGKVTISGPFAFSENGYLTGNFDVAIGEGASLMRTLRLMFPSQADNLEAVFFVLNSMPRNSKGEPIVNFSVKDGKVRTGFIKLGKIPRL